VPPSVAALEPPASKDAGAYAFCIAAGGDTSTCASFAVGGAEIGVGDHQVDYKIVLGADARIKVPGLPGELRVWIGDPLTEPHLPSQMSRAEGRLPAIGQTAKVTPFAPAFEIDPGESVCVKIDPTGSVVRFKLKPTTVGIFNVGADVKLFSSDNCSGTPVPKTTETLQVEVIVDSSGELAEHTKQLWNVFWGKFVDFWGLATTLFFGLLLFLIRGKLKRWFSFESGK
jgi:hypothetical protein